MTNQAKECCEWNEAVEVAAKIAENWCCSNSAKEIRSLKRAPSHQAGQEEADDEIVYLLMQQLKDARSRIETLKEALRPLAEIELWRDTYPDAVVDADPCGLLITAADVRRARAALDDGGG